MDPAPEMASSPGQVIRQLRLALNMSQAEFARNAGWAPSTISRWERGRAVPGRLAFKIILAFAEERGVRYRPKPVSRALIPLFELGGATRATWTGRYGEEGQSTASRPDTWQPPAPALIAGPRPEAFDPKQAPRAGERCVSIGAERPGWSAEASFRLSVGGATKQGQRRRHVLLRRAAVAAAGVCLVVALGMPGSTRRLSPIDGAEHDVVSGRDRSWLAASVGAAPSEPSWERRLAPRGGAHWREPAKAVDAADGWVGASASAREAIGASSATDVEQQVATANPDGAAPAVARLESVVLIGGTPRATFRTDDGHVTVTKGSWLGRRWVGPITNDQVTLVSPTGEASTVHLGLQTQIE